MNQKNNGLQRDIDSDQASDSSNQADTSMFSVTKGLLVSVTITGYILAPLIVLGGIGWGIDAKFATKPWGIFIGLFLAFISSNTLIFTRANKIADKVLDKND